MDSLSDSERETTALIVEVTGTSAALILSEQHNHAFHFYTPNSPQSLWSGTEPNYSREQTPVESVDRETKTYFRLPWTRLHEKDGYLFGREESNVHFLLPRSLGRALSAVHFKLFLSKHRTWMIESLSSNGTMYLGLLRQFEQRALHPDEPNEIRIGDLRLTVHVPNNHIPCQLRYGTYRSGYNEASIGPTPSATSQTSSDTGKQLSQTPRIDESEYHICRSRPVPPAKPKKFVAVRTWDGRPCVMKPYSGPQSHYAQIMGPSRSCESIVSYIELLENGELGQTIVTEYVSALTLAELRANSVIEPTMVSLVYGDIIRALRFLEESDLVHRDIRLETILASPARVWLTGFSACIRRGVTPRWLGNCDYGAPEVRACDRYDSKSDVYSLSSVCFNCLLPISVDISTPGIERGDPWIRSLLEEGRRHDPGHRRLASEIETEVRDVIGDRLETPFKSFVVRKKWQFKYVHHNDEDWIRAKDLLDVVYAQYTKYQEQLQGPFPRATVFRRVEYITLRSARKLCHRLKLEPFYTHLGTKKTEFDTAHKVHYHAPSLMYNVDQILRLGGIEAATTCMETFKPKLRQEVRGVKAWEGTYIDSQTFQDISNFLAKAQNITIHRRKKASNPILAERFSGTVCSENIILVTDRFEHNMLYLRRVDGFVDWNPFSRHTKYRSVQESVTRCIELKMPELQAAIQSESREFQWPLLHLTAAIDFDSDATSIMTAKSFNEDEVVELSDDDLKFRLKKFSNPL